MITVTEEAVKELQAFFESHADVKKSVRVFLAPGGCCGPTMSMALDEADDQDMTEVVNGITFCMQKDLFEKSGNLTVELGYMGFSITTEKPLEAEGGHSCGGGCCGSCGSCSSD